MKTRAIVSAAALIAWLPAFAAEPLPGPEQAFQDHIAYVATFAMPILIETCAAADPGYLTQAAPAYFRFVNDRQDQIERGRLLTLAELAPDDTLKAYRQRVLDSRLAALDAGDAGQRQRMCAGALAMLTGEVVPGGVWPSPR